jgi:hypothetical protein
MVQCLVWKCEECGNHCNIVRSENRCLCGHRYKEHGNSEGNLKCTAAKCPCRQFDYMCAEGSWVIRCRCKHKHTEHNAAPGAHPCTKTGCKGCKGFDSPFVCNCNHGWASHRQQWVQIERQAMPQFDNFGDPSLVKRGLSDDESKD